MSYRDELSAAHARIEALERQLASTESVRDSEAQRELRAAAHVTSQEIAAVRDEVRALQQTLAAERSLAANRQASLDAQLASASAIRAAEAAKAEAVLAATKDALEVRVTVAARERELAERALEELAGLTRAAALRIYQGRLAEVRAERAKLAAEAGEPVGELRPNASTEEQVRHAMAQNVAARSRSMDAQLAPQEAHLARLCAILEQPPRE